MDILHRNVTKVHPSIQNKTPAASDAGDAHLSGVQICVSWLRNAPLKHIMSLNLFSSADTVVLDFTRITVVAVTVFFL